MSDPLTEGCAEACALLPPDADSPIEVDGPCDPDRSWAWRDEPAEEAEEPGADDGPGLADGPLDTEESWQAWRAICARIGLRI